MSRRVRPLSARLNSRNSRAWCELDVGSVRARVFLVDRESKSLAKEMNSGQHCGWTEVETGTLLVAWDLSDEMAEQTLLHELIHQVIFTHGVQMHPDGPDATEAQEESVVNPLASNLFDALKRNGMIVIPPRPKLPVRARKAVAS